GLGVKLHAFGLVTPMPHTHDDAVIGLRGDRKLAGQGFALDDQGMIASRGKGIREFPKDILTVVMNLARLAVEKFRRANHFSTERRTDRLVSEANAKDREFSGKPPNQLDADSRVLWCAWSRRNHDAFGLAARNFLHGNLVVAMHFDIAAQLAEILRQVIRKRVVVIEQKNHG